MLDEPRVRSLRLRPNHGVTKDPLDRPHRLPLTHSAPLLSPRRPAPPGKTWAIGDVHGCYGTLEKLLDKIPFKEKRDHLWLVGDLVNRGQYSLEVLRWARRRQEELGPRFQMVLGNHDLHLLAVHRGYSKVRGGDTLKPLLKAKDASDLVGWLAAQPLLHLANQWILVHAGLLPHWSGKRARRIALRLEEELRGDGGRPLLARKPRHKLPKGYKKLRRQLAVLTRVRMFHPNGALSRYSGPPKRAPKSLTPWYASADARWRKRTVVCGHWAAQGLYLEDRLLALDSACAWGGKLSALRLEDRKLVQVRCRRSDLPA